MNYLSLRLWAEAVKDRDGKSCVECGATKKLHSHHIKRKKDFPELRFDLDNGITLCAKCHLAAHGYKEKEKSPKIIKINNTESGVVLLLKKVGWRQTEFARRIGATPETVNSWCLCEVDSVAYRLAIKYLELVAATVK